LIKVYVIADLGRASDGGASDEKAPNAGVIALIVKLLISIGSLVILGVV
jgi:hypothetical protein